MSIKIDNKTVPTTPASGKTVLFAETTTKKLHSIADDGVSRLIQPLYNANTSAQSIVTSDTYIAGSSLAIPPSLVRAGAMFQWTFGLTRSGAGVATPVYSVRFGTNGSTADTSRLSFTGVAQVNASDTGVHRIYVVVRSVGASGIIVGIFEEHHIQTTTGLANAAQMQAQASASSGFDTTVASSIIGVSVNPGATSTWVYEYVTAIGFNL
jgi:hypothetical protein